MSESSENQLQFCWFLFQDFPDQPEMEQNLVVREITQKFNVTIFVLGPYQKLRA